MGGDEPPEASMRKGKPGRTKPSSRVKKIVKEGNKKFVGPKRNKQLDENYHPYAEEMRMEDQEYDYVPRRGYDSRKRVRRREAAEDERSASQATERIAKRSGRDAPVKTSVDGIYYKLRENLSPANARLLDILAGRGGSNFQEGSRVYTQKEINEMIPF